MTVWHMELQSHVQLRSWMRWCPDIVTKHLKFSDEQWEQLKQDERK